MQFTTSDTQKMRTKRIHEILQNKNLTEDDFVFVDNYIKTYFPEPSKVLKGFLNKEGLTKVYQALEFKNLKQGEILFINQEFSGTYYLIVDGQIDVVSSITEDDSADNIFVSYSKGGFIAPDELEAKIQDKKDFHGICKSDTEILTYKKEHYEAILKESHNAGKDNKVNAISKAFLKIKKMDKASKEEHLTYFKTEKFAKGTIMINPKNKIEDMYILEKGKILLGLGNDDINSHQAYKHLFFGIINPKDLFNEWPLAWDKNTPYYALCVEDCEVLVLEKANLSNVADNDTLTDLRANCQCKLRLQSAWIEKFAKMSHEEIENSQKKIFEKIGTTHEEVAEFFNSYDPKNKNSVQYKKNLEKFNKTFAPKTDLKSAVAADSANRFSEYATPRLVSKDPNFKNLDPQRQLALLALRNEGAMRRSGNVDASKKNISQMNQDDIMKMQSRLLNEEKSQCDHIVQRKTISEKNNLNKVESDETVPVSKEVSTEKTESTANPVNPQVTVGGNIFNKMKKLDNNKDILAKFQFGVTEKKAQPEEIKEEQKVEPQVQTQSQPQEEVPTKQIPTIVNPSNISEQSKPVESSTGIFFQKPEANKDADEIGLGFTKKSLANLLGVPKKVVADPVKTQSDMINKKRTNLLKNPNLLN